MVRENALEEGFSDRPPSSWRVQRHHHDMKERIRGGGEERDRERRYSVREAKNEKKRCTRAQGVRERRYFVREARNERERLTRARAERERESQRNGETEKQRVSRGERNGEREKQRVSRGERNGEREKQRERERESS